MVHIALTFYFGERNVLSTKNETPDYSIYAQHCFSVYSYIKMYNSLYIVLLHRFVDFRYTESCLREGNTLGWGGGGVLVEYPMN